MLNKALTLDGKIRQEYQPAIYLDSSVLIDYWLTESWDFFQEANSTEQSYKQIIKNLLRSDEKLNKMADIRMALNSLDLNITLVYSPLSLLEVMEWNAEKLFKDFASEVVGVKFIQRMGKKEIGNYLKKILDEQLKEIKCRKNKRINNYTTGLETLTDNIFLNRSFTESHVFQELRHVDIVNFSNTIDETWDKLFLYPYLQLGGADMLHVLFAKHLGCKYLASFDSDFDRVKNQIFKQFGISVLNSSDEILKLIKQHQVSGNEIITRRSRVTIRKEVHK